MPDLLCNLQSLPDVHPLIASLRDRRIHIRRPNPWEASRLRRFIEEKFTEGWADETACAFYHQPVTCFIALTQDRFVGFAAYECTRRNYFGPTGVDADFRGMGAGAALYLAAMTGLRQLGYTYAVIGGAGPVEFYRKHSEILEIPFAGGNGIYEQLDDPQFR